MQIHYMHECEYVTEYWKTDRNVTLGQLHFIGPATLMHYPCTVALLG